MPDQLTDDPVSILRSLLSSGWNNANTTYSVDPRFSTGWWDWGRDEPVVTITNAEAIPISQGRGPTGYTYITGDGEVGQRYSGTALVNGWAGTFETDALAGEDGGDRLSPKKLSWEFCREIKRILRANHEGTTTGGGGVELTHVAPGSHRRIVETDDADEHPTLFRYEVEARFGYHEVS